MKELIYYIETIAIMVVFATVASAIVVSVFRWGYEKEKRGERYGKVKK